MTQQEHDVDCLAARETLDLAHSEGSRPDGENRSAVELARRHLQDCPDCQRVVSRREQFDRRIGILCRDVEVPTGLKDRLLAGLVTLESNGAEAVIAVSEGGPVEKVGTSPVLSVTRVSNELSGRRRQAMRWTMAVAACLAVALVGGVAWRLSQPKYNFDELGTELVADGISPDGLAEFTSFPGGVVPSLPATMNTQYLATSPKEFQRAAVYFFTMPMRRGAPLQGWLVVVPKRSLIPAPPAATRFLAGMPQYKNGYCLTAWVEGDVGYLCCVTGTENELRRLVPVAAAAI